MGEVGVRMGLWGEVSFEFCKVMYEVDEIEVRGGCEVGD